MWAEKVVFAQRAIPSKLQTLHQRAKKKHFSIIFTTFQGTRYLIIIGTYNSQTLQFRQLTKYSSLNSNFLSAFLIGGKTTLILSSDETFVKLGVTSF